MPRGEAIGLQKFGTEWEWGGRAVLGEDRLLETQPEVILYGDDDGKWPVN